MRYMKPRFYSREANLVASRFGLAGWVLGVGLTSAVSAAEPVRLELVLPASPIYAGQPARFTVRLLDAQGQVVTGTNAPAGFAGEASDGSVPINPPATSVVAPAQPAARRKRRMSKAGRARIAAAAKARWAKSRTAGKVVAPARPAAKSKRRLSKAARAKLAAAAKKRWAKAKAAGKTRL
jgi:hypothetical protein